MASPPAARPANTPASPRFSCIPSSSDASGSAYPDTTNATLVPMHRSALAHLMTIRRQPAVHPVAIRTIQLRLRQPFIQPQKGVFAAVPKLKISLPTAIRLLYHCRPAPHILRLTPPAHPGQYGAFPTFNPLADRRHADPENPGNGARRTALLVHRQSALLVGGAGALVGGIGDGAASAVASVINLAACGGAVFGHPVGAAFGAADIVTIDAGAGYAGISDPKRG